MKIQSITSGPFETNSYLLVSPKKFALIVDPTFDTAHFFISHLQKGLIPLAILLTHSHLDHTADVAVLKEALKVPVYVHALDKGNLEKPGSDGIPYGEMIKPATADVLFYGGEEWQLEDFELKVIHTPGHSFGSSCFYFPKEKVLISGDTLFKGTIGNLSFPTSEPDKMWDSLKLLSALDPDTVVLPGHGESTTIGAEPWIKNAKQRFNH
jgi:glyoxylase-like metal-dependent hydrolase (beta-lactamase superfamily II)